MRELQTIGQLVNTLGTALEKLGAPESVITALKGSGDLGLVARWIGEQSEGVTRIARERIRQVCVENYNAEHDDAYSMGELADAAAVYALVAGTVADGADVKLTCLELVRDIWPFPDRDPSVWKPSQDPIRNLEKAGALIAAEIDRLVRLRKGEAP